MQRVSSIAAVAIALGVTPGAAAAAVSCDRGGGLLEVAIGASGDSVSLLTDKGEIEVSSGSKIVCTGGTPTVLNTDTISIHNAPGLSDNAVGIFTADLLVPGLSPEPGDDEIEIFVNLNGGAGTLLGVATSLSPGRLVFGTGGINANASDAEEEPDDDIDHGNTAAELIGIGDVGPDLISARGGRGTGGPVTGPIWLMGSSGEDTLLGGDGPDLLQGDDGRDTIAGFAGDDQVVGGSVDANASLTGGEGDDTILPTTVTDPVDGGPGEDLLSFREAETVGSGVSASLQGTGAERLEGTQLADLLIGDAGPNVIRGLGGGDQIDPRGGADVLDAGPGDDALQIRDGEADTTGCGAGSDTVSADALGVDLLSECETATFPPLPDPPGTAAAPGFSARTLVTLALAGKRFRARGPIPVQISNANPFTVTGTLAGNGGKPRIALSRTRFSVAPNARVTVKLGLPDPLRRRFAHSGRLSLRLIARVRDPSGAVRIVPKLLTPRL